MQADAVLRDPLDRAVERIQPPLDVLAVDGHVDLQDEAGVDDRPVERLGRFRQRVDEPLLVAVVLVEDEAAHPAGPEEGEEQPLHVLAAGGILQRLGVPRDRLGGRNSAPVWDVRMRRSLLCMAAVSRPAAHRSPSCVRFRE
jgi:hypothetical protein